MTGKKTRTSAIDPFELVRHIKSRGPAPVHLWDPPFCGNMELRIARDGTWFHEGKPIRRPAMVRLFASILRLDSDRCYYLVTPEEKLRIQVEDCPFVIIAMDVEGSGPSQKLQFETNTGETIIAGEDHRIRFEVDAVTAEPHPVVHVRSGLNALLNRAVFYRLVDLVETRDGKPGDGLGIWSAGRFFELDSQGSSG